MNQCVTCVLEDIIIVSIKMNNQMKLNSIKLLRINLIVHSWNACRDYECNILVLNRAAYAGNISQDRLWTATPDARTISTTWPLQLTAKTHRHEKRGRCARICVCVRARVCGCNLGFSVGHSACALPPLIWLQKSCDRPAHLISINFTISYLARSMYGTGASVGKGLTSTASPPKLANVATRNEH